MSRAELAQLRKVSRSVLVPALGIEIFADLNKIPIIRMARQISESLSPGMVIETKKSGSFILSELPDFSFHGLGSIASWPSLKVLEQSRHFRSDQELPTKIPVSYYDGSFYCPGSSQVSQGDVLILQQSRYLVLGVARENAWIKRIALHKQIIAVAD